MGIFKRLNELEIENEKLKEIVTDQSNLFSSIYQKAKDGNKENLAVAYIYYKAIMDMAQIGIDIKNEADLKPTSNY